MDNLEKNDSTKELEQKQSSEEPVQTKSDAVDMQSTEEIDTDTSVDNVSSEAVQDLSEKTDEVQETADDLDEVQETADDLGEVQETADDLEEVQETADDLDEVQETADDLDEVQETADDLDEVQETADDLEEAQTVSDAEEEVQATTNGIEEPRATVDIAEKDQETVDTSEKVETTPDSTKEAKDSPDDMEDFMDMYEESFKRFAEGEVVTGKIISVDKDHVLVDIGYKSEGQIRINEFKDEDGNLNAEVGDPVDVMVEWWDEEEERVVLSKEKATKVRVWEEIKKSYDEDGVVEGVIVNRVKGGFSVDIGVQAFLPGSQADLRPIRNLDDMVGETFAFKILKYNRKRSNIVLSRRAILELERESQRAETLGAIHEDKLVEGIVKNITEYGVFVDLGGVDGLLHITDISWGRVKHPSELFAVGDEITVKILNLDVERERVSLGMKQLTEDPWATATEKYTLGSRVRGKVVSLTDYGAFVELEEGIEGLIHVSEMSWTRKANAQVDKGRNISSVQ